MQLYPNVTGRKMGDDAPHSAPANSAGYRLTELPIGRTHAYSLINKGELTAVKSGNATIITNWPEYLARQPRVGKAA